MAFIEENVSYIAPTVKEFSISVASLICTSPGDDGNTDMEDGGDLEE